MGKQKDFRHVHHISHKKKDKKIDKTTKPSKSSCHEGYLKNVEGVVQAELESIANTKKICRKVRKEVERLPLLAKAVFLGCERVVDNILEAGENVNEQVQGGKTPLIIAVENGFPGIVQKLLKKGADPKLIRQDGRNALMIAVSNNDNRSFTTIWNYWDKSNLCELNHSDSRGFTVLTIAAEHGHSQITHFLLSLNGIEIDKQTSDGRTPLMFAVMTGQSKTVQKFLSGGSDVALEDKDGTTAVCLALTQNEAEIKSLLIESLDSKSRDAYVKKRVELLSKPRTEDNLEAITFYKDVLFRVILEIRKNFEDGVSLLEKYKVFNELLKCLKKHEQDTELLKCGFHLAACVMYDKAEYSRYIVEELVEQYIAAKGADFALKTMNAYRLKSLSDLRGAAFLSIHAGTQCRSGKLWLKTNYFQILHFVKEFRMIFPTMTFWADGESVKARIMFDRFEEHFSLLEKDIKENHLPPLVRNEVTAEAAIPATQMVKRNRSISNMSRDSTVSDQQWSVVTSTKSSKVSNKAPRNQTLKKATSRKSKGSKLQTKLQRKIAVKKLDSEPNVEYIPGLSSCFPALPREVKFSQTGYADALKKNLQDEDAVQHAKKEELYSKESGSIFSKPSYSMVVSSSRWTCNIDNGDPEQIEDVGSRDNAVDEEPKIEELEKEDLGVMEDLWTSRSRVTHDFPFKLKKLFMNIFMLNAESDGTCNKRIQAEIAEPSVSSLPAETSDRNFYYREFPPCDITEEKCDGQAFSSSQEPEISLEKQCCQRRQDTKPLYEILAALGIKIPHEESGICIKVTSSGNLILEDHETSSLKNHMNDKNPDLIIDEENLTDKIPAQAEREDDSNIETGTDLNSTFESEPSFDFDDSKTSSEKDVVFHATDNTFAEKLSDGYDRNDKRKYSETCLRDLSFSFYKEEIKETGKDLILSTNGLYRQDKSEMIACRNDCISALCDSVKTKVNGTGCSKAIKSNYGDPQSLCRISGLENSTVYDTMHQTLERSFHAALPERVSISCISKKTEDTEIFDENNSQIMVRGLFSDFNPKPCKRKMNLNTAMFVFSVTDVIPKLKSVGLQKYISMYQRLVLHKLPIVNRFLSNAVLRQPHESSIHTAEKECKTLISNQNYTTRFGKLNENNSSLIIQKDYDTLISQKLKFDRHYRTALLHASGKYPMISARRRGMKAMNVLNKEKRKHSKFNKSVEYNEKNKKKSETNFLCNFNNFLYGYKSHFINCESDSRWYKILRKIEYCIPLASFLVGFTEAERNILTHNTLHELVCSSGKIVYSTKEEHVLRPGEFGTYIGLMANGNPVVVKEFQKTSHGTIELLSKKRRVSHRNVAEFYCVCNSSTNLKLIAVTELLEYTLPQYLRADIKPFNGKILVQQLVEALRYLHKRQVVHGFLKPSNVMVSIDYRLKITDFYQLDVSALKYGLCPKEQNKSRAPVGQSLSDTCWRPHELVAATNAEEARKYLTAASDVQMAGMLIYYILSHGKHPFGSTDAQCLENIRCGFPELGCKPEDSESRDLIQDMIKRVPPTRPAIGTVEKHPYFWDIVKRFKFLLAVAKKIEFFTRKPTKIAEALNDSCIEARNWTRYIPYNLLRFISQSTNKTYGDNFLDLLLFFLAIHNNFEMMPSDIMYLVRLPSAFVFSTFPSIFMSVYSVVRDNPCAQRQMALQEYF